MQRGTYGELCIVRFNSTLQLNDITYGVVRLLRLINEKHARYTIFSYTRRFMNGLIDLWDALFYQTAFRYFGQQLETKKFARYLTKLKSSKMHRT